MSTRSGKSKSSNWRNGIRRTFKDQLLAPVSVRRFYNNPTKLLDDMAEDALKKYSGMTYKELSGYEKNDT